MEGESAVAHYQPPVYTSSNSMQGGSQAVAARYASPLKPHQSPPPTSSYSVNPQQGNYGSMTAAKPLNTSTQSTLAQQRTTGTYSQQSPNTYYQSQATTTVQPLYTSQPSYSVGANYPSYPAPSYATYAGTQTSPPTTTTYTSVQPATTYTSVQPTTTYTSVQPAATYTGPSYISSIGSGQPTTYQQHFVGGGLHSYVSQGKIYAPHNAELVPAGSQLRGDMYALYDTAAVPTFEAPLTFEGPAKQSHPRQDNNAAQQVRVTTRGGSNLPTRSHAAKKREKRCCGC